LIKAVPEAGRTGVLKTGFGSRSINAIVVKPVRIWWACHA